MQRRIRVLPKFWLFVIAIMLLAFGVSFAVAGHSLIEGQKALAAVTSQRDALVQEVTTLTQTLDFARTDEYVIRVARDELGMIMPGEIRYIAGN